MQQRDPQSKNLLLFMVLATGLMMGYIWLQRQLLPPPEPVATSKDTDEPKANEASKQATPKDEQPKPVPPVESAKLEDFVLGGADFNLKIKLTSLGAGVKQVILPHFKAADPYGHVAIDEQGNPLPLELVPEQSVPSYLIYHYDRYNDDRPLDTLGKTVWRVVERPDPASEVQRAVFETDVPDFGIRLTRTYTLRKGDYHLGHTVTIKRLPDATSKAAFRYQITSARGLPLEGQWYYPMGRSAYIGWRTRNGTDYRHYEDAGQIHHKAGGDKVPANGNTFTYAAVGVQFFAAAVVVDDDQPTGKRDFIDYARATDEDRPDPNFPQRDDITVRLVARELNLDPGKEVTHAYLLYNGPMKIRLLGQLGEHGLPPVEPGLVERYVNLGLLTLTDYQSPGPWGSFSGSIGWAGLLIFFTNIIHTVMSWLYYLIPNMGWCVLLLTIAVRLLLLPISLKQARSGLKMQEAMKRLQPELKRLEEDFNAKKSRLAQNYGEHSKRYEEALKLANQEYQMQRLQLMMKGGANPFSQLGGCFLGLAQAPIFMGLFYALQESIFFRLESFLWMPNLAAPDMLIWWGESIPFISDPNMMGSIIYMGPYFNLLPCLSLGFMIYHMQKMLATQQATLEPEQVAAQRIMFRFMFVMMFFMFYKVAAGLCLYFVATSIWGILERQLLPKPSATPSDDASASSGASPAGTSPTSSSNGAAVTAPTTAPTTSKPDVRPSEGVALPMGKKKKTHDRRGMPIVEKKDQTDEAPTGPMGKLKRWWSNALEEYQQNMMQRGTPNQRDPKETDHDTPNKPRGGGNAPPGKKKKRKR
jgi:YidC/Oxa1 family membrane protein insertase